MQHEILIFSLYQKTYIMFVILIKINMKSTLTNAIDIDEVISFTFMQYHR